MTRIGYGDLCPFVLAGLEELTRDVVHSDVEGRVDPVTLEVGEAIVMHGCAELVDEVEARERPGVVAEPCDVEHRDIAVHGAIVGDNSGISRG